MAHCATRTMRILVVCWYEFFDGIAPATDALRRLGHVVEPFGWLLEQPHSQERFQERMQQHNDDVVVFWNWRQPPLEAFEVARKHAKYVVLYDWDAPYVWYCNDSCHAACQPRAKSALLDVALTCSTESIQRFRHNGASLARILYPTFDPVKHFYDPQSVYECDVAFICTNVYESGDLSPGYSPLVYRKPLLDSIYAARELFSFRIYGPPALAALYPECYGGKFVRYDENRHVFSSAKVSLNHHAVDAPAYLNERTVTMMASGAVMLVDRSAGPTGALREGVDCEMYGSIAECLDKIDQLCKDAERRVTLRQTAAATAQRLFNQDTWSSVFEESIASSSSGVPE